MGGSLLFCSSCKRVIGYADWNDIHVLKDVRLLYVVPIEVRTMDEKQFTYFRLLDHGPQKRKCEIDIYSEPPFKRFKFDNTHSVIVMRARVERDESLEAPDFVDLMAPDEIFYDSETESAYEMEDYIGSSDSDFDPAYASSFENERGSSVDSYTLMDLDANSVVEHPGSGVVAHLYWVSTPILCIETQDEIQLRKFCSLKREIPFVYMCVCL